MFIGEAPGRLGADETGIPFHGDKAGHNFEELLAFVGISREDIFITNAVLCNPKDSKGNNAPPSLLEVKSCTYFLRKQIDLVDPQIVVTLGSNALKAANIIEDHNLSLKQSVRTNINWYNRTLIPLYHPGQRAMIHRSMANQRSDYKFIADKLFKKPHAKRTISGKTNTEIIDIIKTLIQLKKQCSYFSLHKLFYLLEYNYIKENGHRLTTAFFLRQKDGPYCTDLHIKKIKSAIPELIIQTKNGSLLLSVREQELFYNSSNLNTRLIEKYIKQYLHCSDNELKTKVYMTKPMRDLLKLERNQKLNMYNAPIDFV